MVTPEEVKSHRTRMGFSQAGYARQLGITPTSLWRYEAGKQPIPKWLEKIIELEVKLMIK